MQTLEIYRCPRCGMQMEVTVPAADASVPPPLCCGLPMEKQEAVREESVGGEKHLPVIEPREDGILVKVGSRPHPMTPEHHIEWIEVLCGNYSLRTFLRPDDLPQAPFFVPMEAGITVRESCNLHGIWETKGQ